MLNWLDWWCLLLLLLLLFISQEFDNKVLIILNEVIRKPL